MFLGGSAHLAVAVLPTLTLWSWDLSSYLHAGAETGVVYLERPSAKSLQLPVATSGSTDQEAEITRTLLCPKHPNPSLSDSQSHDEWDAGGLSTLRKEHWCGIFAFLTSRETILPIGALLCARALRSGAFADAGLWQLLMQQRWLQNGAAGASSAFSSADYRLFTHAVAAESICSQMAEAAGLECVADAEKDPEMDPESRCFCSMSLDTPFHTITAEHGLIAVSSMTSEVRLFEATEMSFRRLPPLRRSRRGAADLIALCPKADSGLLAVAEVDGIVRLEDVTQTEASCPELTKDSLEGSCQGLFWLGQSLALCSAWRGGAALYDATRPHPSMAPVVTLECGGLLRALRWSNHALLASAEGLRLWDFRCPALQRLSSREAATLTALAVDSDGYHAAITTQNSQGLGIEGFDLRKAEVNQKPLMIRDLLGLYSQDVSKIPDFWTSCLSVGRLGETCAVFSDGTHGLDYMACFAGGPGTVPLVMGPSNFNITALQCAGSQCASLVGVSSPSHASRGWAELRWLSRAAAQQKAIRRVKPKKFFRQHNAGENDFRERGLGRRGRR
eukprot:s891_g3.t4